MMETQQLLFAAVIVIIIFQFIIIRDLARTKTISELIVSNNIHFLSRLLKLESVLGRLGDAFGDFADQASDLISTVTSGQTRRVYHTADGAFSSDSLDGLIEKIKSAGADSKYDIEELRTMFEESTNDSDTEDDDDSQ